VILGFFRGVGVAQSPVISSCGTFTRAEGMDYDSIDDGRRQDSRFVPPNDMTFIFIYILAVSGMIMRMMFNLTMSFCSLRMMGCVVGRDMG